MCSLAIAVASRVQHYVYLGACEAINQIIYIYLYKAFSPFQKKPSVGMILYETEYLIQPF